MRKRRAFVIAVAVVCVFAVPVAAQANITNVQADDFTIDAEQSPQSHLIQVTNDGNQSTTIDVQITETPTGVVAEGEDSVQVPPGETVDAEVLIDVGSNAENGEISGAVVAEDGSTESFSFDLTVAPQAGFQDEPADLGEVLVAEQNTGTIGVEEITGESSLDGVEINVVDGDPDAQLEFFDQNTVTGSSGTVDWEVIPNNDAPQGERLEWTVEISDARYTGVSREVDIVAEVIYPGYFGQLELADDEFRFDEPRSGGDTFTRTYNLEIPNDGDRPLEVTDIGVSASDPGIDAEISSTPSQIDGQSTAEAAVRITADRDLDEGDYDIAAGVAGVDTTGTNRETTVETSLEIIHETQLTAEDAVFGDVAIGEGNDAAVTISEEFGYNDVRDVEFTLAEGPDDWLTLEDAPSSVSAASSRTASFSLEFDTSAELGQQYRWVYDVEGDVADTEVTVTASPVPLDLEPIRNELSGYDTATADSTLALVDRMDERLRAGESNTEEVSTVLTFGEAAALYVGAVQEADDHLENGENEQAQAAIIRAAAAYNTMGLQADRLQSDELRELADTARGDAEGNLDRLIQAQQDYYEGRLESGEMSLLEEATTQRQLARIALLQGNEERAAELESEAEATFESYSQSVSTGEQAAQRAETTWTELEDEQFITVFGQPLLLNPAGYDAFVTGTTVIDAAYQESIAAFESAGESARAEEVRAEYEDRSAAIGTARYSLFGAIAVYALIAVGITVRTARRMFWYVQDTRESVSGDFLV